MAIRIRVYPQANSVGARTQASIRQKNHQIVALRQQVALLRQQLATMQAGYGAAHVGVPPYTGSYQVPVNRFPAWTGSSLLPPSLPPYAPASPYAPATHAPAYQPVQQSFLDRWF